MRSPADAADDRLECWLLIGSQSLYGEETLRQVAIQAAEVASALDAAPELGVRVVAKPVLTTADGIRETVLQAGAADACIGVIAWMHTFSPAKAWIAGLQALRKPLLHLHTQANRSLPWDTIDMDFMNLNQSAHGDREFGYIATRLGIRRKVVVGHVADPDTRARIGSWVRAARGWRVSQNLRLARFGDNMRDVAVTDGDRVEAQRRFGWSVQPYGVNDLVAAVEQAPAAEIDALVDEYLTRYSVAAGLLASGDRHSSLRDAAQIEVGLRGFLERGGFEAFTTNFEDLGGLKQLPGIAAQRLMADGYGFGAEGDWKTSALLRVLKTMSRPPGRAGGTGRTSGAGGTGRTSRAGGTGRTGGAGGTSFMEDYTYHFGPGAPKLLGAHMLEICPSITTGTPSCEIHPLSIGNREDPVRLVFDADPGAGFVVGILDVGDRFRLVANTIEIVPPDAPLPRLPVARATWKPAPSLATSAECWITAGGPHHTVLSTAVDRESLEDLATIAGVELAWIDDTTDARAFAQELNWNQAYYRVAGAGLP